MTRSKLCYQKGSVQLHNGQWTLRYRELDHATGKWKWPREILGQFKTKKAARQTADPIMRAVNERNNNPAAPKPQPGTTFKEFVETHWNWWKRTPIRARKPWTRKERDCCSYCKATRQAETDTE